jgi:thiamine biosynthesis lipoprotein
MATDVAFHVERPNPQTARALEEAREVFARVEAACTRFDPDSPLMRANASPDRWHVVPLECADAVREAGRAHRETGGLFDPRVLDSLLRLGYDRTLPFAGSPVELSGAATATIPVRPRWRPRTERRGTRHRIHLGGTPIDLGGIGKGLAVRWAWERLRGAGDSVMVDAGGDCMFSGPGPDGDGWHVGVEDPLGGEAPVAVLVLTDAGCATSSIRVRRWKVDGRTVHHLIDPRTGESGGDGLLAVSVIHPDTAWAEVWSKTLFLAGPAEIGGLAEAQHLAAVWVEADGTLRVNDAARPLVLWTAPDGYL